MSYIIVPVVEILETQCDSVYFLPSHRGLESERPRFFLEPLLDFSAKATIWK
jgi:hypothetical protein